MGGVVGVVETRLDIPGPCIVGCPIVSGVSFIGADGGMQNSGEFFEELLAGVVCLASRHERE